MKTNTPNGTSSCVVYIYSLFNMLMHHLFRISVIHVGKVLQLEWQMEAVSLPQFIHSHTLNPEKWDLVPKGETKPSGRDKHGFLHPATFQPPRPLFLRPPAMTSA